MIVKLVISDSCSSYRYFLLLHYTLIKLIFFQIVSLLIAFFVRILFGVHKLPNFYTQSQESRWVRTYLIIYKFNVNCLFLYVRTLDNENGFNYVIV